MGWYLLAFGSNRRSRWGSPAATVRAAMDAIGAAQRSSIVTSAPVGPSARRFANAVALVDSDLPPPAMLARVKAIERMFGRRRGQRWGTRVIDLDLIGWSGGVWRTRGLTIPHVAFRERRFVLDPLAAVAPGWRDPVSGLTVRHLHARLTRARPVNRRVTGGGRVRSSVGRASDF